MPQTVSSTPGATGFCPAHPIKLCFDCVQHTQGNWSVSCTLSELYDSCPEQPLKKNLERYPSCSEATVLTGGAFFSGFHWQVVLVVVVMHRWPAASI